MDRLEQFLTELAEGIRYAAGTARYDEARAMILARRVWQHLAANSVDAYPSMAEVEEDEMRFVYQWDEEPRLLTIMIWVDVMWQDMVRIVVPPEVAG